MTPWTASCGNPRKLWFCSDAENSSRNTTSCFTIALLGASLRTCRTLKNNYTDAHHCRCTHSRHSEIPGSTYLKPNSRERVRGHVRYIDVEFRGRRIVVEAIWPQARCYTFAIRRRFILTLLRRAKVNSTDTFLTGYRVGKRARASSRVAVSAQYAETVHTNVG